MTQGQRCVTEFFLDRGATFLHAAVLLEFADWLVESGYIDDLGPVGQDVE